MQLAIEESLQKEESYIQEGTRLQSAGNKLINRSKEPDDIFEDNVKTYLVEIQKFTEMYGASYSLEIIVAYLSAEIGMLDDAIKHSKNAFQLSPHSELANELYSSYKRKKMYRAFLV